MHSNNYILRPTPLPWIPEAWWPAHDDEKLGLMSDIQSAHDIDRILSHVDGRKVVVQAGAAMGIWAKKLAQEFGTVYTFEPHPQNFRAAVLNLLDEENVVIQQAALGDTNKLVRIDFPEHPENHGGFRVVGKGDVPTVRIDDLGLEACDLLYLDIEGAEWQALRGAAGVIGRFGPVVVIEDKPGCCRHFGYNAGDIGNWLQKTFGYKEAAKYHGGRDKVYTL